MLLRLFPAVCLVFALSFYSFAQAPPPQTEAWRAIKPDTEEFSIDSPVELAVEGLRDAGASRRYMGVLNGTYFYVFSDPLKSQTYLDLVTRFARSAGRTVKVKTVPDRPDRINFEDKTGFYHNISSAKTKTRVYIVQTVSLTKADTAAEKFVRSLAIDEASLTPVPDPGPLASPSDASQTDKATDIKPAGTSSGAGSGSGKGSGKATGAVPPASHRVANATTALRIISKDRASYTDLARLYGIEGTVILRVEFLDTGEIGSVTPVKLLPFGLVERAIVAARTVKFEPKYVNGTPISVTRLIEYSFSIY